jgi:nucleotide-binding universal stress UspA family protein
MLRSVLLPTDFSDECRLVWAFARGLPAMGVHRVVLAHVVDASGLEGPIIAAKADEARDRLAVIARDLESAGLLVELRVLTGEPFRELLALAAERSIDGIVAGTHGKHIIQQMFQGSVSERLLQESACPMLAVKYGLLAQADDPADLAREFGRSVVMPTDFSGPARHAFDVALAMPPGVPERLHLVHVVEDILDPERAERVRCGAEFQLENLQEIAERNGVTTTTRVRSGSPGKAVLAEVVERNATGVIVGSRGRAPLTEALIGSVSMTVFREAACPVLVVH